MSLQVNQYRIHTARGQDNVGKEHTLKGKFYQLKTSLQQLVHYLILLENQLVLIDSGGSFDTGGCMVQYHVNSNRELLILCNLHIYCNSFISCCFRK